MGWRGFLRSAAAQARRVERERMREANRVSRLHQQVGRMLSKLSREAERDLRKVEAFEHKIYKSPIKTLDLQFLRGEWVCSPLEDRTGDIVFSLSPQLSSDAVAFDPPEIEFDGKLYTPLACCLSAYATFIAFSVQAADSGTTTKNYRLVKKSNPDDSAIAIIADEQAYFPFDESIDGQPIPGVAKSGIIAFEPFADPVRSFRIAFLPRPTKRNPDPEPTAIDVTGRCIREVLGILHHSFSFYSRTNAHVSSPRCGHLHRHTPAFGLRERR
jgi:hypothetical protein